MYDKNKLIFVIGFVFLSVLIIWQGQKNDGHEINDISVSGSAKLDVAPDEAQIFLRIETIADTAKEAQDKNSESASKVIASLKDIGNIDTVGYHVEVVREWSSKTEKFVERAVSNGANNVDNIVFGLSKDKQKQVKDEVLSLAVKNAREKSQSLADGLGVGVGKVRSVSESSYDVIPLFAARAEMSVDKSVPVQPSDVSVQADVRVVFEVKQ